MVHVHVHKQSHALQVKKGNKEKRKKGYTLKAKYDLQWLRNIEIQQHQQFRKIHAMISTV